MRVDIEDLRRLIEHPFFIKEEEVEGRSFLIVDYKLALPEHFMPLYRREFRGMTIDPEEGKIYWSIHKFFNINETEETKIENLKGFKWEAVEKVDGSLIQVIWVGNNPFAKTRKTFKSPQARNATRLLRDSPYINFITWCKEEGLQPLFEYVGPDNQIVVFHPLEKLVLIAIRNNNGRYIKNVVNIANKFGVPFRESYGVVDIRRILHAAKTSKGTEGWVLVNTENPRLMVKVKTTWYLERHKLFAGEALREDMIIKFTLENKIDDIVHSLDGLRRESVLKIARDVIAFIEIATAEIGYILSQYGDSKEDRKALAIKYKDHPLFSVIMRSFSDRGRIRSYVVQYAYKNSNKLEKARRFLKEIERWLEKK